MVSLEHKGVLAGATKRIGNATTNITIDVANDLVTITAGGIVVETWQG